VLRTDACVRAAPITPASGPVHVRRLLGPAPSAFTELEAVRRSHPTFRGLLRLHSCCGPHACQPAFAGLCPRGFDGSVALPAARVATEVNRQLLGLDFHQQHQCTLHGALKSRWTTTPSAALRKHRAGAQSLRPATGSCSFSHSTIPITSDSSHSETPREVVFAPILYAVELRPTPTLTENRHQLSLVHYSGPLQ